MVSSAATLSDAFHDKVFPDMHYVRIEMKVDPPVLGI